MRLEDGKTSTEKSGMDKKYITFYKKFILQTKTLNDGGVEKDGALMKGKVWKGWQ